MEFTIGRDDLYKGIQRVQGIVSSKGAMPVLANALIEAGDKAITIFATNLDMGLRGSYPAKVKAKGNVTIQAKKLHDILKELPSEDIVVKVDDDGRCRVISGNSKFKLATISSSEFPSLPDFEESSLTGLDAEMMTEMIKKTSYAISQDETRLTLNGAFIEVTPTKVSMVATDGHRLAFIEREGVFGVSETIKAIIARKAIHELEKLLDDSDGSLKFCKKDNHLIFEVDSLTLAVRLIDGAYPNYEQVIPKSFDREGAVVSEEFANSLRRVVTLADEKSHMVRFAFSKESVELVSEGGELGEAKDETAIKFDGEDVTIGLNAYYLLDSLKVLGSENVIIKMNDQLSPVMVVAPDDANLLCIVMPMRL